MLKLSAVQQRCYDGALPRLRSADWAEVRAGIEQLTALGGEGLMRRLASGITNRCVSMGLSPPRRWLDIKPGCWVEATVVAAHRKDAALWIAVASGKLDGEEALDLREHACVPPLRRLVALRRLWLGASVGDLGALAGLSLSALYLHGTPVDLRPLASLASLERLCLTGSEAEDLSGLAGVPGLRIVEISEASAARLTSSVPLPQVKEVVIAYSRCVELPILEQFPGLSIFKLSDCPCLRDLSPLSRLTGLTTVELDSGSPHIDDALLTRLAPS